jgi:regulator of RNase E activity RraA
VIDYELLGQLFSEVDTTAIADCDASIRAVSGALALRSAQARICAPAFTVRTRGDIFPIARAVELAPAGSVLVVEGGGEEIALSGELFARAAQTRGLAGLVIDGGVRDQGYLRGCPLPVYSRHVTPKAGTSRALGEFGGPVACGGVTVRPGDTVLADQEGIIVLSPDDAERLVRAAHTVKETEARAIAVLASGGALSRCLNIEEHQAALAAEEPSSLRFLG